jgi:hypothetical protein
MYCSIFWNHSLLIWNLLIHRYLILHSLNAVEMSRSLPPGKVLENSISAVLDFLDGDGVLYLKRY